MNVFFEFSKIAEELHRRDISYALIGGVAVAFYVEPRLTKDIDFLISALEFPKIGEALNAANYFEKAEPWVFHDSHMKLHRFTKFEGEDYLFVNVLIGLDPKHQEIIANAVPTPLGDVLVKVATKPDLIWLKEFRNSKSDRADIEKLRND